MRSEHFQNYNNIGNVKKMYAQKQKQNNGIIRNK